LEARKERRRQIIDNNGDQVRKNRSRIDTVLGQDGCPVRTRGCAIVA
jgi:hypothetical protein